MLYADREDSMKKIGIITCGKETNFGACLQALATQHKINELGFDAEIMNYSFRDENYYSPFHQYNIRSFVSSVLFYRLRKSLYFAFQRFREKNMKYSRIPLRKPEDFLCVCNEYDAFLVGSDQVWNPYLGIDIDITLLRFYKNGPERLSYASSFGVATLPEHLRSYYKEALDKFTQISTREVTGKQLIKSLTGRDAVVSLDPTMLLTDSEWSQYEEEYKFNERYVLIYDMRHSSAVINTAKKIARKKGCQILALSKIIIKDKMIQTLFGISPGQFLYLFRHAEAVVTDSFHGTAFSILYHKEFYTYCSKAGMSIGSRITNILDALGLGDRLINDDSEIIFSEIEYNNVDERMSKMRLISLTYLRKILSGDTVMRDDCITNVFCTRENKRLNNVGQKNESECCGCCACSTVCPAGAISMEPNEDGFLYPTVDEGKCIHCHKCVDICAFENGSDDSNCCEPIASYIARTSDKETLENSSSGGMFTALSDEVIDAGGTVYGAVYTESGYVQHIRALTKQRRNDMRGSKYVQSDITKVYDEVLKDLRNGRDVLFSGTPCQNMALKSYLRYKDIDCSNLILCDVICHGVCSPIVWEKYLDFISMKVGKIKLINMRDKKYGCGYNMTIIGEKGKYHKNGNDDPFIRLFQLNLPLRKSCFNCPMKKTKRVTDITIGDFQKASLFYPDYDDKKGVSLVLINTEQGKSIFHRIKEGLDYKACSMEKAMQPNLHTQIRGRDSRDVFFERIKDTEFVDLLKKYTTLGMKNKTIYLVKQGIKTIIGRKH